MCLQIVFLIEKIYAYKIAPLQHILQLMQFITHQKFALFVETTYSFPS